MDVYITRAHEPQSTEYDCSNIPPCPCCGSKAYISKVVADGFYFGWSVGCPRFRHNDGIHGTNYDTPEEDLYAIHGLDSQTECVEKWNERVKQLKGKDGRTELEQHGCGGILTDIIEVVERGGVANDIIRTIRGTAR